MAKESLSDLEQFALLATLRLGREAYGTTIREEIEECTGREMAIGTLYKVLDRLEARKLVDSELGEPTHERGGRAKRYFSITSGGRSALRHSIRGIQKLAEGFLTLEA